LFLEIYNGKSLPKKGVKHLNIWQDWLKNFSSEEQLFLKLVANEVWQKGENELLLDDLLKHEILKPYFTSDIINAPYNRLKNKGWISRYVKDLNVYVGFTVEASLLYFMGLQLKEQTPSIDLYTVQSVLKTGSKLQKSAVESFLSELAMDGDLNLVSDLIDEGNDYIDFSTKPLLLYLKTYGVISTIEKVLEKSTENDWKALNKLDDQLEELQLHVMRKGFLIALMPPNNFETKEAVSLGLKAIAIFDKNEAINYLDKLDTSAFFIKEDADILSQLGNCESKFGNYDKALEYYEKCLAIHLKSLGGEHPSVATSYNHIGLTWDDKGKYDKALEFYTKSLAIRLKTLGGEHPVVARLYNHIGITWDNKDEYDKALEYYEKCLAIRLKTLGGEHPDVASSYNNFGIAWRNKGEYDKSLEYYEKCLAIKLKTLGGEHPDVASSYNNIGVIWIYKEEYDKALEFNTKSLAIRLKTLGGEHPDVAHSFYNIGSIWENKDEYDQALEYYEKCLAIFLKTLGGEHPNVAITYDAIGEMWDSKGEYDKALEYYEKSLAIELKTLGGKHPSVATTYFKMAMCYEAMDKKEQAIDYFIQSAEIRKSDPEAAIYDESTIDAVRNVFRIAKELSKENELPEWMKNLKC
jgi:tetratricopeptide (TPR) repeat protein